MLFQGFKGDIGIKGDGGARGDTGDIGDIGEPVYYTYPHHTSLGQEKYYLFVIIQNFAEKGAGSLFFLALVLVHAMRLSSRVACSSNAPDLKSVITSAIIFASTNHQPTKVRERSRTALKVQYHKWHDWL